MTSFCQSLYSTQRPSLKFHSFHLRQPSVWNNVHPGMLLLLLNFSPKTGQKELILQSRNLGNAGLNTYMHTHTLSQPSFLQASLNFQQASSLRGSRLSTTQAYLRLEALGVRHLWETLETGLRKYSPWEIVLGNTSAFWGREWGRCFLPTFLNNANSMFLLEVPLQGHLCISPREYTSKFGGRAINRYF